MTLPSGQISVSNINTEVGLPASYGSDLNFLNLKILPSQRPANPNLASFRNKAFFRNTAGGNCNNGNCATAASTGNIQCTNCTNTAINCANCDAQSWLQTNCNCACTYNCTQNANQAYNCNCNCACACIACACACSDPTLKEDVAPITGALDKIDELSGYTWAWNKESRFYGKQPGQRSAGLMAPDVERVIPGATFDFNGKQSVKYINENEASVVGYLVESIKELKQRVEELKPRKNDDI